MTTHTLIDAATIKQAAQGREVEILEHVAGLRREILDGKHHPCPKCGGNDRFRFDTNKLFALCGQCFNRDNGDFLAAVRWARNLSFPQTLREVASYLGVTVNGKAKALDPIDLLARKKRCPADPLRRYGAKAERRRVVFPMYGPDGQQCSTFRIDPASHGKAGKGLCAKGKPAGVFLPQDSDGTPRLPQPGETWHVVEGVKDAAALDGLGLLAVGLPTCKLSAKFARMLAGVNVVLVPDRDQAGTDGAEMTAARLHRVAASVRIAALPVEFRASDGADVRDVLAMADGERLVRAAIESAQAWRPIEPATDEDGIEPISTTKGCTEAMNARRFAVRFGADVRYCDPWAKWLTWDGCRWKPDDCRAVDDMAKQIGLQLFAARMMRYGTDYG
jgi:hypothetical protein